MLSKKYRLSKKEDFENLYKNGQVFYYKNFKIFFTKNDLKHVRFAVIAPKKIFFNSVTRNTIKRKFKNLINKALKELENKNFDFLIVVHKNFIDKKNQNVQNDLISFKNYLNLYPTKKI